MNFSLKPEQLFQHEELAARLDDYASVIKRDGKLTRSTVFAIESIKPGLIFESIGSQRIDDISQEQLHVVLEDIGKYKHLLLAGALGAVVGFILKLIFGDEDEADKRSERSSKDKVEKIKDEVKDANQQLHDACHEAKSNTQQSTKTLTDEKRNHIKDKLMSLTGMDETTARGIVSQDKSIKDYLFGDPSKFMSALLLHALKDKLPHCIINEHGRTEQTDLSKLIDGISDTVDKRVEHMGIVISAYETGQSPTGSPRNTGVMSLNEEWLPPVYDADTKHLLTYAKLPDTTPVAELISKAREIADNSTKFVEDKAIENLKNADKLIDNYINEMVVAQDKAREYIHEWKPKIEPMIGKLEEFTKKTDTRFGENSKTKMTAELKQNKVGRIHKHLLDQLKLMACFLGIMDIVDKRFDKLNHQLVNVRKSLLVAIQLVKETEHALAKGGT